MPLEALRRIQSSVETAGNAGTTFAATRRWYGKLTMTPTLAFYMPEDEERASLALLHRRTIVGQSSKYRFEGSANFDTLTDLFAGALNNPTIVSSGSAPGIYRATFAPTLDSTNFHRSFNLEYGDESTAYRATYVMPESVELVYAMGEPVKLTADFFGRFPGKVAFTAVTSTWVSNQEDLVTALTTVMVDTSWAGLGNTTASNLMVSATVRIPSGLQMQKVADGTLDFSYHIEGKRAAELEMVIIHNSTGILEYDAYTTGSLRFIRLQTAGSAITSTYGANKMLRVDMAVRWTEAPEFFQTINGENAIRMRGKVFKDPTSSQDLNCVVINTSTGSTAL